jgi:DNA-binding transcriptional LysR family regulator
MQADARALESLSESVRSTASGKVRLTIAEVLVDFAPDMLQPLKSSGGDLLRQVELVVSPEPLNLLERQADIAVRHLRPSQADLVCRRVGSVPMAAWSSGDYLQAYGAPSLSNLDRHWFVDGATKPRFSMAVERLGHRIPQQRVAYRTDSLHAQLLAAQGGWGIAGLPVYMAEHAPDLVRVLTDAPPVALDVWVAARPAVRHQQHLRAVFDEVCRALEKAFGQSSTVPIPPRRGSPAAA